MSTPPTASTATPIDAATLAAHPELAVLTLDLPIDDGEPMEFERERMQITLLLDILTQHWYDRYDWYAGGNMFLYYSAMQARRVIDEVEHAVRPRQAFRGLDVFVVLNVDGTYERQKWVVWEEDGRYPDVIFEFLSPSTAQNDKTTKKDLYERVFRTAEYYWFDPFAPEVFQGWHLHPTSGYQAATPDSRGWLWSPRLQLWIGTWTGLFKRRPATWLCFYDAEGQLVLTTDEAAQQRAEAAQQQAEAAQQRVEAAERQAGEERQRAEAAEAELARLRVELARQREGTS